MMRKMIYFLIAAFTVPTIMLATTDIKDNSALEAFEKAPVEKTFTPGGKVTGEDIRKGSAMLGDGEYYSNGLIYDPLREDVLLSNFGGTTHNSCSQFLYDEASGIYGILTVDYSGTDFNTGESVYRYQFTYTDDNGTTWKAKKFPDIEGNKVARFPSGGIVNRTGGTTIDDLDFVMYCYPYEWDGQGFPPMDGVDLSWDLAGEDELFNDGYDPFGLESPSNGSSWLYTLGGATVFEKDDDATIVIAQRLSQAVDNAQWGVYGQATLGFPSYNMFQEIPSSWDGSLFYKDPETGYNSTTNSDMYSANDGEGNVYAAVFNQFMENPGNERTPGVSMSSDQGETWTDFNVCPPSVYEAHIEARGGIKQWTQDMVDWYTEETGENYSSLLGDKMGGVRNPYAKKTMVAVGPDNYSVFTTMGIYKQDGDGYVYEVDIVEYHWNGTDWSINHVATIGGNNYLTISVNAAGQAIYRWSYFEDGINLDAARTADGNNVVLTWIDMTDTVALEEPFPVFDLDDNNNPVSAGTIETLNTSDVFVGYRSVGNTEWEGFQVTGNDNKHFNHGLQMPEEVPSLNNIIITANSSLYYSNDSTFRALHPILNQIRADRAMGYYVLNVDIDNEEKYWGPVQSVEEPATSYEFALNTPYPNPASTVTNISFVNEEAGQVTITVYDAVGNVVGVPFDNFVGTGTRSVRFNTNNLAQGTYYIVLSNGNQTQTKMLNVIR